MGIPSAPIFTYFDRIGAPLTTDDELEPPPVEVPAPAVVPPPDSSSLPLTSPAVPPSSGAVMLVPQSFDVDTWLVDSDLPAAVDGVAESLPSKRSMQVLFPALDWPMNVMYTSFSMLGTRMLFTTISMGP